MKTTKRMALALAAALALASCRGGFRIEGAVTGAEDSLLYIEHMALSGPVAVDSVRLGADGGFAFSVDAPETPEFYRLRIAGQIVNIAADTAGVARVEADYASMSYGYRVQGRPCQAKIRELAVLQAGLQSRLDALYREPGMTAARFGKKAEAAIGAYKEQVKRDYIFASPKEPQAYFALFQTVRIGGVEMLIFNPRDSEEDVKVFAAVATSWDTFHPGSERGENLHNIAIEGLKQVRILKAEAAKTIDPAKVSVAGLVDIALPDAQGRIRKLSELGGKVVLLDFHLFASRGSSERIMSLRSLYGKYHARGLEIYQVSPDPDLHFWKTSTARLPWICVREPEGVRGSSLARYNVSSLPTYFIIDRSSTLQKRDVQVKDLEAEIEALL